MISLVNVKQFCKDPIEWIENYHEAVNDTTQIWHCHHHYEIEYNLSKIELQAMGFYFNRPFYELIFLTPLEHKRLHQKGRPRSKEIKQKISNTLKGRQLTEETKQKLSDMKKGKPKSDEWRQKLTKFHFSAEELYHLYVVQDLTQKQIAELYGCTPPLIGLKLKKYGIIKHGK